MARALALSNIRNIALALALSNMARAISARLASRNSPHRSVPAFQHPPAPHKTGRPPGAAACPRRGPPRPAHRFGKIGEASPLAGGYRGHRRAARSRLLPSPVPGALDVSLANQINLDAGLLDPRREQPTTSEAQIPRYSVSLTRARAHAHTRTHSTKHTHTRTLSLSVSLFSLSLSLSLSLSHTLHTHTHAHTHTYAHTHTHTYSYRGKKRGRGEQGEGEGS